jgi:hypothetical protein
MPRLLSARALVLGGLAAGAAYALRNRQTVMGLLGGGQKEPEPYAAPASASPGTPAVQREEPMPAPPVANVDVAGPPTNTATPVPAPEPAVHEPGGGIDEAAEEAAAAAEAANIGGTPEEYPSEQDPTLPADEAMRPLEEAGEGYAEGQELAEADLIDNAEPAAGDPLEGGRAIEDAIEAQDDPSAGEALEGSPAGFAEPVPTESAEETAQMPLDAPPPSGDPAEDVPPPVEDAPGAAALTPSGTAMPEEAASPATPDPTTEGTLAPGGIDEGAPTTGGGLSGAAERSAETKRSEVWRSGDDQPTVEQPALDDDSGESS